MIDFCQCTIWSRSLVSAEELYFDKTSRQTIAIIIIEIPIVLFIYGLVNDCKNIKIEDKKNDVAIKLFPYLQALTNLVINKNKIKAQNARPNTPCL